MKVLETKKENTKLLEVRVNSVEKMYRQARLSQLDLIREQDALADSRMKEVDTNLRVIHIFLDHFKVFTKTPCQLNMAI